MVVEIDRGVDINFPNICSIHYNYPHPPSKKKEHVYVGDYCRFDTHSVNYTIYIQKVLLYICDIFRNNQNSGL